MENIFWITYKLNYVLIIQTTQVFTQENENLCSHRHFHSSYGNYVYSQQQYETI